MKKKHAVNNHGLPRTIPDNVKREIRQNCGFGCVICGNGITEYEHVDPVYTKASEHDPAKMTLLCGRCHNKVTKGLLSKEKVKQAMLNPKALQVGYASEFFEWGENGVPDVSFAGSKINTPVPLKILGHNIIEIVKFEGSNKIALSGKFFDSQGNNTLNIVENEWIANTDNWDVTVIKNTLTVREKKGKIVLEIISNPPDGLTISRFDMNVQGVKIVGNVDNIVVNDIYTMRNIGGKAGEAGIVIE